MITGYPEGSNLTIMNAVYRYPGKDINGKHINDSMTIVYKDNNTGKKGIEIIDCPTYEYYMLNDDQYVDHNLFFEDINKTKKIITPYSELLKSIAENTGNEKFFYDNIKSSNRRANNILHTHERVLYSDTQIEDHFRFRFDKMYKNDIIPITKSYFDIEADTTYMKGDFPEMGECPINALTFIDDSSQKVYTLLLRNEGNQLIEEFERNINLELFKELKDFIIEAVGGWKQATRYKLMNLEFEFLFFDSEIELIETFFKLINYHKPDFALAWNMGFDIPYIIERIKVLGYNPADIMSHPDFKYKKAEYFIDELHKSDFAERGDFATISSYTIFLDQLIHFASRRKGQSKFPSFKLDIIGEIIAKVRKVDYSHITHNLSQLPYLDYKLFVFYNIMDTIVQKCIEVKTNDIDYIFGKCVLNNTRYHKGHRQTVYLTNRSAKEFYEQGYIIGNNSNRANSKPEKFPGALVGDPTHNSDYSKLKINNHAINIADNLDDFDFKSLYPSIQREFDMSPNTQIGRIIIDNEIYNHQKFLEDQPMGGKFLEDLQSHVWLEFCHRWLHLGGYLDVYKDIEEFFTSIKNPNNCLRSFTNEGLIIPISLFIGDKNISPINIIDSKSFINPIEIFKSIPKVG
jgi:DNA polymerase elongation subunit (family B)